MIINANRREGTSRAVVEVAERLARRHEVTVFSRTAENVDRSNLIWRPLKGPSWPDVAEFEWFRIAAERVLSRQKFDIIHSAGCNLRAADVYAIQTVHPQKMQINDTQARNDHVGLLRRSTRALYDRQVLAAEKRSYHGMNKRGIVGFLPVSQGTERELRESYPVNDAMIEVIPNGADLNCFHPGLKSLHRTQVRCEIDCQETDVAFLFAGGEWRRKGLQLALEGLSQSSNKNAVLVVSGDDPQRQFFFDLAAELDLNSRVRWLGFRHDIERIYGAADVFLFPSAYEAFSLATIEAAATGLPVVMCNISGAFELIGDGTGGRIVDRSPVAIGRIIDELAGAPSTRQKMGLDARNKVERLFQWDTIAIQTESFYQRLLRQRRVNSRESIQ